MLETMRRAWLLSSLIGLAAACHDRAPGDVEPFTSDPLSAKQGYMLELGVPAAWERERGSVTVAVVDNGFDLEHPDLAPRLWANPDEIANGLDDDGDGRVDDLHGWDFVDGDGDVSLAPDESGPRHHGTAVAGIIAAETENGLGIAGLCPGCRLMLLRCRDFQQVHDVMGRLSAAVDYAIAHGARVINVSDGVLDAALGAGEKTNLEAAAARAAQAGVVLVAAAGNDGADAVRWPARIPSVFAAASVDWSGAPSAWTSFGLEIDAAAPGEYIETTFPGGTYGYFEGTSAAAPVAAALAALLASAHPAWTAAQVAERMRATARPAALDERPELALLLGAGVVSYGNAL